MTGYITTQQGENGRHHPGPGMNTLTLWSNHGGLDPAQRWQPNKRDGRVLPGPLGRVHRGPRGGRWNMWLWRRGTEGQRTISNPKKGRSWYLRSTDDQTPKKEGVDIWEVQTDKTQNGKNWSLTRPANKERTDACNLSRKGKESILEYERPANNNNRSIKKLV